MEPFRQLTALACPLPMANVDTDQLIPARFMKRSRAEGYGGYLLHDLRFDSDGSPRPDFPLNRPSCSGAKIIVARRNFGAGSSREAAVYALADYGIRCVIAPSFGDIFASNAVNNGLLPALVPEAEVEALLGLGEALELTVDLEAMTIEGTGIRTGITLDPVWRLKLLNGWDDIDLTLAQADRITAFVADRQATRPWAFPRRP